MAVTFGVLFSNADNFAQMEMWRGINEFAKQHDIHLIAYMGTYQSSHLDLASHMDTCFDSIYTSKYLDGVILFSGFISHLIGGDEIYNSYVSRIPAHIPCVSLSQIIPNIPSILADNVGGIYSAVDHLIKNHGKRQIAFVRGPDGHQEAEDRLIGYKKALADNKIPFDANYVLPGDFSHEGARRATVELLDNRKIPFDAVATSDDISAIQILTDFKRRGIQVPTDIAITGFDDDRDAATFIPSVSTSKQDFYGMGIESANTLLKKIKGEKVDDVQYVRSVFIARQSCGCFKRDFGGSEAENENAEANSFIPSVLKKVIPHFPAEISTKRAQNWVTQLVRKVIEKPFRKVEFLNLLDEILVGYSHRSKEYDVWHELLNIFMVSTQRYKDEIYDPHLVLETLLHAVTLVNDISGNEDKVRENLASDSRLALRRVTSALVLMFDIDALADELFRLLPEVQINMALIGLYSNPIRSSDTEANRTIDTLIGFDGDARFNMKHNSWNPIMFSDFSTIDKFDLTVNGVCCFLSRSFLRMKSWVLSSCPTTRKLPYTPMKRCA
ncbi:MAG: substrate-binding domain-containing protein [Defluviitaleaceae bacterium]|nr:substrate-binding domain-containing protein [Defluviitaleaceae bacterium]